MVIIRNQGMADNRIKRLDAIVPNRLATLRGTDLGRLADATWMIRWRLALVTLLLKLVVLLYHCSLFAWNTKRFPQKTLGSNHKVCKELREEDAAYAFEPDLALFVHCLRFTQLPHVVANTQQTAKPRDKLQCVSATTCEIETLPGLPECRRANM